MNRAPSIASFIAQPIDRSVVAGKTIAWCKRPSLGGAVAWGRATASDTQETIRAFEALFSGALALQVDVILDGRAMDGFDPAMSPPMPRTA